MGTMFGTMVYNCFTVDLQGRWIAQQIERPPLERLFALSARWRLVTVTDPDFLTRIQRKVEVGTYQELQQKLHSEDSKLLTWLPRVSAANYKCRSCRTDI